MQDCRSAYVPAFMRMKKHALAPELTIQSPGRNKPVSGRTREETAQVKTLVPKDRRRGK